MLKRTLSVTVLALGLGFGVASADAGSLYSQDFDAAGQAGATSVPAGWKMVVNNSDVSNGLTVSDGTSTAWGGVFTGYYATGDNEDFALGFYPGSTGATNYIKFTYTATGKTTNLSGSFDVEMPWSRYDENGSLREVKFNNGFRYSVNGDPGGRGYNWGTALIGGNQMKFSTLDVPAGQAMDWFNDSEMDANGLAKRGLSFELTGLELEAGDTITFGWFNDYSSGSNKNMILAVDNFELNGHVVPLPAGVWAGMGMLGAMGGLRKLRKVRQG